MSAPIIAVSVNSAWNLVNFRKALLQALVGEGYRVIAIAPPDGREAELSSLGVEFEPIPINGRGMSVAADVRLLLLYLRLFRRLRPDAYLGYTIKPNVYGGMACRILSVPRIANIAGLGTAFMRRDALNYLVRFLYRIGLKGAEKVFFQNRDDCQHFLGENILAADGVLVLPGSGVDLAHFRPIDATGPVIKFLLVARLLFAKGVGEFVEAASKMKARHGNLVSFSVLGIRDQSPGGVDATTLRRWEGLGVVNFLDAVSDVRPALAQADCIVLPSYYPEGTPRSLLEAAAMGKAIITTDAPGCRDVVDEGVNGFLCTPRDTASLVSAMERYCALPLEEKQRASMESRRKAEQKFDEKIVISAYLDTIRAILSKTGREVVEMKAV